MSERWIVVPPEGGHGDWEIHTDDGLIVAQGMSPDTAHEIVSMRDTNWLYRFRDQNRDLRRLHRAVRQLLLSLRDGTPDDIVRDRQALLDVVGG